MAGNIKITYRDNNTFTVPSGVTSITVQCEGGGGGGGVGSSLFAGGGGGGGAYASSVLTVTPLATYAVVVGQQVAASTAGQLSSFGTGPLVRGAAGAAGGAATTVANGSGGAGGTVANSIGTTRTAGTNGVAGAAGGAGAPPLGGSGGAASGGAGTEAGGGGGGGAILSGAGGTGARGVVVVTFDYVTETITANDSFQLVVDWKRTFNETAAATDSLAKLVLKPFSESVTASDAFVKTIRKPVTESVSTADTVTKTVDLLRGASQEGAGIVTPGSYQYTAIASAVGEGFGVSRTIAALSASANAPVFINSASCPPSTSTRLSIDVPVPTGTQTDDVVLFAVVDSQGTGTSVATPSGLTLVGRTVDGSSAALAVFWRRIDGTEPAAYTFTGTTAAHMHGCSLAYRGMASGDWVHTSAASTQPSASATYVGPTISTTANTFHLHLVHDRRFQSGATSTPVSTWTCANLVERYERGQGSSANSVSLAVFETNAGDVVATDVFTKRVTKPQAESVTATDAVTSRVVKTNPEVVTAADAIAKIVTLLRTETVVSADTIAKLDQLLRTEGLTATDTIAQTVRKAYPESVVTADTIAQYLHKPVAEGVTTTDLALIVLVYLRNVADIATATDQIAKLTRLSQADAVVVTEGVMKWVLMKFAGDGVTVSDSFSKVSTFQRGVADSVVALDGMSRQIGMGFADSISGSVSAPPTGGRRIFIISD